MQSNPHIMQSINSQHSLPDPNPKLIHMKAAKRKRVGGCSHPLPWICGSKPPDSGDKKLWGCAAVGYPHHDLLQDSSSHDGYKDNQQSSESNDYGGACKGYHNMETGPLWGSHVGVIATLL